jgi:CPA1 family monovalent cation:H+ antiporter
MRAGVIFSLAGARGAVTLASVMSIPLMLADGNAAFPERSLIILLAGCVIVISLLVTNFILPLFAHAPAEKHAMSETEEAAYAEIIQTITGRLLAEATEEHRIATLAVVGSYYRREGAPRILTRRELAAEKELLLEMFRWEKENTLAMLAEGLVGEETARHFIEVMETRLEMFSQKRKLRKILWLLRHIHLGKRRARKNFSNEDMAAILASNTRFVLDRLRAMKTAENEALLEKLGTWYELSFAARHIQLEKPSLLPETNVSLVLGGMDAADPCEPGWRSLSDARVELALKGFQMERDLIQEQYEAGHLSWKTAREMRGNIAALEARLQDS